MILAICNPKGGAGKTTVAVNLAAARAIKGHKVLLVDGDDQGSASISISLRTEAKLEPRIACSSCTDWKTFRARILPQKKKYDDIIIDAGARDSGALRATLTLADILLVPFLPRAIDIWAFRIIADLAGEISSVRARLKALALLNMADPILSADNSDAVAAMADFPLFKLLPEALCRRKAYATAIGSGRCVLELRGRERDRKAEAELEELYSIIF